MRTLRDAQSAARDLGKTIGRHPKLHAGVLGESLGALDHRLSAIEAIIRELATRTGLVPEDILPPQAAPRQFPAAMDAEVRRILT